MTPAIKYEVVNYQSRQDKKKVIFILPLPPTIDFDQKFFIKHLQENNISTEYWVVGNILGYIVNSTTDSTGLYYINVLSLKDLRSRLRSEHGESVVFVPQITRNMQSLPIYFLLKRLNKKTVFFGRGYVQSIRHSRNPLLYYLRRILKAKNKRSQLYLTVCSALFRCLPIIKKHDLVFTAGKVAEMLHSKDAIKISKIHHFDVDCSITNDQPSMKLPDKYFLFIDEYLPFHPDFRIIGDTTINATVYYRSLNDYFSYIEKEYDTTIIIAAHPRAIYVDNPYENRMVIFNLTNFLIKKARFVLAHRSTAISYAVIHEKPLGLMFNDDIKEHHPAMYNHILETAKCLGCAIFNFEKCYESDLTAIDVDKRKYRHYYAQYLSSGVDVRDSYKIVLAEINSLLDHVRLSSALCKKGL